jgi:hypothetical protein
LKGFLARLNTLGLIFSIFVTFCLFFSGLSDFNEALVHPDRPALQSDGVVFFVLAGLLPISYVGIVMTLSWLLGQGFRFQSTLKLVLSRSRKIGLACAGLVDFLSLVMNLTFPPTGDAALRAGYNPEFHAAGQCFGLAVLGGLTYWIASTLAKKSEPPQGKSGSTEDDYAERLRQEAKVEIEVERLQRQREIERTLRQKKTG